MPRRKETFFSRALVVYNPWPEIAGAPYDRSEMVKSVKGFCESLEDFCGTEVVRHDNVDTERFRKYIEDFIKRCKDHDAKVVYLYICTHALIHNGRLHLMMDDSENPDEDLTGFLRTSISGMELAKHIRNLIKSMYDQKVVVFLECCHAGALLRDFGFFQPRTLGPDLDKRERVPHNLTGMNAPVRNMASANNGYGYALFFSSGENEPSYVGLFTDAVVRQLAANKKEITVKMLSKPVSEEVSRKTRSYELGTQTPVWFFYPSEVELGSIGGLGDEISDDPNNEEQPMEVDQFDGFDLGGGVIPTSWAKDLEKLKTKAKQSEEILERVQLTDDLKSMSEKLETMKEEGHKLLSTETRVVFAGEMGCGKSTLINALVKAKVLPMTGAGKGCTSTILEIRCNKEDDRFKATVFFFTEEEWKDQLTILTRLASDDDADDEVKKELGLLEALKNEIGQCLAKGEEEVIGQAMHRHVHKYGLHLCHAQLYEEVTDTDALAELIAILKTDTKIKSVGSVFEKNATDLMQELITYCSSGLPANSKKKMLWRIVKKVQVFLPDCEVLPKDVVLVDIPGFNDSNQTREELARKQFSSAEVVWILAGIKRALDSATLNDLMRKLRNKDVSFILTRSDDDMDVDSYISELKGSDEFEELNASRDEIAKEKKKKKRTEMKKKLKMKCVKHRNSGCKKSFQEKLASGYKGIEHLSEAPIFSVSGGDYLKILADDEDGLFEEEEETGVPDLQQRMHKVAENNLRGKIRDYLIDVYKFAVELKRESVRIKQPEVLNFALRDNLMSLLENRLLDISTVIKQTIGKIKEDFAEKVAKDFDEKSARSLTRTWNKLPHQTQKAVILRNGYFERKDRPKIDLYTDVVQNSVQCIADWGPKLDHLQDQLEDFRNNWIIEENAASALKQLLEKYPNSERIISARKLRDVGLKPLGNLKSDIEDVQDLVIELITKKVKKEVVPLCEAHSRKKKAAMMFICYDLRKKFKSLKESVERTAQTPINGIEHNGKKELEKYKQSVLDLLVAATTAGPDQKPAAGSSESIANELMKDITRLLSEGS